MLGKKKGPHIVILRESQRGEDVLEGEKRLEENGLINIRGDKRSTEC